MYVLSIKQNKTKQKNTKNVLDKIYLNIIMDSVFMFFNASVNKNIINIGIIVV